jgi:hypothetical protein
MLAELIGCEQVDERWRFRETVHLPSFDFVCQTVSDISECGKYCTILSCVFSRPIFSLYFSRHFPLSLQKCLISLFWLGSDRLRLIWRICPFILYKCVFYCLFEWVLIWLTNSRDQIKFIKRIPWPLFPQNIWNKMRLRVELGPVANGYLSTFLRGNSFRIRRTKFKHQSLLHIQRRVILLDLL